MPDRLREGEDAASLAYAPDLIDCLHGLLHVIELDTPGNRTGTLRMRHGGAGGALALTTVLGSLSVV